MKLSTRGRYAARAMVELALRYCKKAPCPVQLKEIARAQHLPLNYLENLLLVLKRAGLVRSFLGMRGGYVLARAPLQITLLAIIESVEGDIAPCDCVVEPDLCSYSGRCVTHSLWQRVRNALTDVLGSTTLQDLVDELKQGRVS